MATAPRPLRADALRNRERLVAAARELIAMEREVTLESAAHRAWLGVGTAYRRFPDRVALLEAALDPELVRLRRALVRDPDDAARVRRLVPALARDPLLREIAERALAGSIGDDALRLSVAAATAAVGGGRGAVRRYAEVLAAGLSAAAPPAAG